MTKLSTNDHSFISAISIAPLQVHYYSERSRHGKDTVPEFHAEAPQATAREGFVPGPYVASREGCLFGLTFLNFDLAPKRNEKFGYCGLDFV